MHAIDPERPLERLRTLDDLRRRESTADRRALSVLLALAAAIALLISTIGVYGVTAATTAARRRELAIRAAIGADRGALMRLVVRQAMAAAAIGIAVGIAGGVAASSVLEVGALRGRRPAILSPLPRSALALLAVCCARDAICLRGRALTSAQPLR